MLYQTTGATTVSTTANIGYTSGTHGSVILKGGSFSLTSTANPLNIGSSSNGYGEFANSSGTVSVAEATYIAGSGSFYSQNAGSTNIGGFVSIGTGSLLLVNGGSYQSNDIYSNGTLELGGSLTGAPTATVSADGLQLESTATLEYDFTDIGIPTLNLGTYSISQQTGAKLVYDLTNYHNTTTRTFTLATYSTTNDTPVQTLANSPSIIGYGNGNYKITPSVSDTSFSVTITPVSSNPNVTNGVINSYSQANYQYGPSLMYDETEGLYKVWYTEYPDGATGTAVGDDIVYKEYPTLVGLSNAPATYAFTKTDTSTTVDGYATADPTVYRDPATGGYYLAYTGNASPSGSEHGPDSEIGMAGSADGGREFAPYNVNTTPGNNGELVNYSTDPNSYGVGQASVVYAHGYWWMFLTNQEGTPTDPSHGADISNMIDCIRSPNANFTSGVTYVNAWNYGGYGSSNTGLSNSVGAVYDPTTDQILLVSNGTDANQSNIGYDLINITPFNWNATAGTFVISSTFTALSLTNEPYSFGEGLGVLSSSDGTLFQSADPYLTLSGASSNPYLSDPNEYIEGSIVYMELQY